MAYVGPSYYVVVVMHVGGSKASADIKLVLHRELRKTWFLAGSILPNEEHVEADVRELLEETSLTLTYDDLTMLSDTPVHVALPEGKLQLVYVFFESIPVSYVIANLRSLAKLEQVVSAQSTINPDGSYVVPTTTGIDGLSITPTKHGLLPALKRKYELLHFGYVTQWETFRQSCLY
jgi:8-oxo-dGTP pyrophosphatase MutT (NUDIX family)